MSISYVPPTSGLATRSEKQCRSKNFYISTENLATLLIFAIYIEKSVSEMREQVQGERKLESKRDTREPQRAAADEVE